LALQQLTGSCRQLQLMSPPLQSVLQCRLQGKCLEGQQVKQLLQLQPVLPLLLPLLLWHPLHRTRQQWQHQPLSQRSAPPGQLQRQPFQPVRQPGMQPMCPRLLSLPL
jgi:hypothetical protein